jgi:hypothetical protein
VSFPEQTKPTNGKNELLFLEFRKLITEYVSTVHDTMRALHNRPDCKGREGVCAYCRRRLKAETELLKLIGSEPAPLWLDELSARLCAADTSKKM